MEKYYVYEWFNINSGIVFYVGKGTGRRYLVKNRNNLFNQYINENNVDVKIVARFEREEDSFLFEQIIIQKYKAINQCFCNLEFGGNGGVSEVWTDEMRLKMSINNPMKDEKQRKRMSVNNPMKNKEIAEKVGLSNSKTPIINGIEYLSPKEASENIGVHIGTIWSWCKRGYDTNGNKCYYKEDGEVDFEFKKTNSKQVIVNGQLFESVKSASNFIGVYSESLIRAIKKNKPCRGYYCWYANQQPSDWNPIEVQSKVQRLTSEEGSQ